MFTRYFELYGQGSPSKVDRRGIVDLIDGAGRNHTDSPISQDL